MNNKNTNISSLIEESVRDLFSGNQISDDEILQCESKLFNLLFIRRFLNDTTIENVDIQQLKELIKNMGSLFYYRLL